MEIWRKREDVLTWPVMAEKCSGCRIRLKWMPRRMVLAFTLAVLIGGGGIMALADGQVNGGWGAVQIQLIAQGKAHSVRTSAESVDEMLREQGITLGEHDRVSPDRDTAIREGMNVHILRAFAVTVRQGEKEQTLYLPGGYVRDALIKAEMTFDSNDLLQPAAYAPLEAGMVIEFTRVEHVIVEERTAIVYEEKTKKDPELPVGQQRIETPGQNGEGIERVLVTQYNGEEISREVLGRTVLVEPVNQLTWVGSGAKPVDVKEEVRLQKDRRGEEAPPAEDEIARVLSYEATAYTHTGSTTATGIWPQVGTIAVNPEQIPYGTRLYVEGYGYGVAADTGAFRHSGKKQIDLFMHTKKECVLWGRKRNVKVYVLKD